MPRFARASAGLSRLPARDELIQAAAEGNRSLNQEIVYRLANTLEFDRQFLKSAIMQDAILDVLAKGRRPRVKRK
jgi:hypothetical protein